MALRRVCLDTSAYSHFSRGEPGIVTTLRRARAVGVPAVVLGELRAGFRLGRQADENEQELARFLGQPVVSVLDVDDEAASHYADLIVALKRSGTPVPANDVWIAALALREGATVLTFDGDFARIPRVGVHLLAAD